MKRIINYMSGNKMIGHKDATGHLEFGDSCQRTATLVIASGDQILANTIYILCIMSRIEPVRYPDSMSWYGQHGCMSRDNFLPIVLARPDFLLGMLWRVVKRGGFMWNTKPIWSTQSDKWKVPDWCGLAMMSGFIRGFGAWYLWPLLWLTDVSLPINALIRRIYWLIDSDNVGDDLNLTLCFVATQRLKTPVWWLGWLIYRSPEILRAWAWYFRSSDAPPMDVIMEPVIKKVFSV